MKKLALIFLVLFSVDVYASQFDLIINQRNDNSRTWYAEMIALAESGDTNAMYFIAKFHRTSIGDIKSLQYLKAAADAGNIDAMNEYAYLLSDADYGKYKMSPDIARYYQMAVDMGNSNAMYHLAYKYINGEGVSQNIETGIQLFELSSIERDNKCSQREYASYLRNTGNFIDSYLMLRMSTSYKQPPRYIIEEIEGLKSQIGSQRLQQANMKYNSLRDKVERYKQTKSNKFNVLNPYSIQYISGVPRKISDCYLLNGTKNTCIEDTYVIEYNNVNYYIRLPDVYSDNQKKVILSGKKLLIIGEYDFEKPVITQCANNEQFAHKIYFRPYFVDSYDNIATSTGTLLEYGSTESDYAIVSNDGKKHELCCADFALRNIFIKGVYKNNKIMYVYKKSKEEGCSDLLLFASPLKDSM